MASAGSITWDLIANSSKFVSELEKANKAGKNWGDKLGKAAKGVATTFAAAGAAAAASLTALYTVTASNIDEQAKFADKIGVSTDALGGLHHAADLTGVSTENMNLGLQRMTRRVAEAAQGTGTAVDALDALNLSAQDLNQLSPDEQFLAIADAMGEVEGRSEQVRLAFKLFDSGGVALLNTMDMASDGIRDAMEQAEHLGIALNRIDAAKVENANDAFDVATKLSAGLSRQITVELAPIVEGLSVEFLRAANEFGGFGEIATTVIDAMIKSVAVLADSWRGLEIIFQGLKVIMYQLALDTIETIRLIEYQAKGMANSWRKFFGAELLTMNRDMTDSSIKLRMELNDSKKAIIELANTPLPSDKIQTYVHQWRNLSEAQAIAAAEAKKYNQIVSELEGKEPVATGLTDEQVKANERNLDALQRSLGYQEQVINRAYQNQIEQIENLVLEEEQIRAAGFETLEDLQAAYLQQTIEQWNDAIEEMHGIEKNFWETFVEDVNRATQNFSDLWTRAFHKFTSDFGDAVADAVMTGEGFEDSMKQIAAGFARSMIAALVQISTQQAVVWLLNNTLLKKQQNQESARFKSNTLAQVETASLNTLSSISAVPVYGPAAAPAAAAATRALAMPMATAAIAAANSGLAGMAHLGISEIPDEGSWLLDRGERVLSAQQNQDLMSFMNNQKSAEQVVYSPTIVVESGASQSDDLAFAERIIDEVFNRLVQDGKVNGPVRRAMNN